MALGDWAWVLVAANAVAVVAVVAAAAILLRRRRGDPAARTAEWYGDAVERTREVQRTVEELGRPADPDRAARRLLPLSGRIRRHVREAPPAVAPGVHRGLFELATRCQQVAVEHRPAGVGGGPFLEDRLEALADDAGKVEERIHAVYRSAASKSENAR